MTEEHGYMIEAALWHGFEMTNDDGTEFRCTEEQIIALLTPCHEQAKEARKRNTWNAIEDAPRDRRILVKAASGEIYAAHWVQNPMDGQEAFLVSESPDGTQHLVKPIVWREI